MGCEYCMCSPLYRLVKNNKVKKAEKKKASMVEQEELDVAAENEMLVGVYRQNLPVPAAA